MDFDRIKRIEKVMKSDDPLRLVYMWIKQDHISFSEFKIMIADLPQEKIQIGKKDTLKFR